MTIEDKIYLRELAFNALDIYLEKFILEDEDYIDFRAVRGKEKALNNRIKKMSELTGVDKEKIYDIVVNFLTLGTDKYLNELRDIGIPIATLEDIQEFRKKVECDI